MTIIAGTDAPGNGRRGDSANAAGDRWSDAAGKAHRDGLPAEGECPEAALDYLETMGWSVLAVCPPDHVGVGKTHGAKCTSPGKAPWGEWKQYQDRLPTKDEIDRKWRDNPQL